MSSTVCQTQTPECCSETDKFGGQSPHAGFLNSACSKDPIGHCYVLTLLPPSTPSCSDWSCSVVRSSVCSACRTTFMSATPRAARCWCSLTRSPWLRRCAHFSQFMALDWA